MLLKLLKIIYRLVYTILKLEARIKFNCSEVNILFGLSFFKQSSYMEITFPKVWLRIRL